MTDLSQPTDNRRSPGISARDKLTLQPHVGKYTGAAEVFWERLIRETSPLEMEAWKLVVTVVARSTRANRRMGTAKSQGVTLRGTG